MTSTKAPDPYTTAGWTIQHQHRTSADPPYLEPDTGREDAAAEKAAGTQDKRKPRKRT